MEKSLRFSKTASWLFAGMIFILALEIGLRIAGWHQTFSEKYGDPYSSLFGTIDKTWYHTYRPGEVRTDGGDEFSFSFKANNEGFLDSDFSTHKDSGTFRILILGDSFVQGIGVRQDKSFPEQLEILLKTYFNISPKIEVYNCGIGNSDPIFQYKLLFDRLLKYKPDLVIDVINGTDINDITIRGGFERFKPDGTLKYSDPPGFEPVYAHSYIARTVVHEVLRYNWMFLKPSEEADANANSLDQIKMTVYRMDSLCYTKSVSFLLITHPLRYELRPNSSYAISTVNDFCNEERITNINIKDYFDAKHIDASTAEAFYWPKDGHFKKIGYKLMADISAGAVIEAIYRKEDDKE